MAVTAGPVTRRRNGRARLLLAGVGCAVLGTACVFLSQEQTESAGDMLAAIAWLAYIAAATLAVAYAFASGRPAHSGAPELARAEKRRARKLASTLSTGDLPRQPPA